MLLEQEEQKIKERVFEKLFKDFNDKYIWIISFYKENGGITISDSHLKSEIKFDTEYEKFIPEYNLKFKFKIINETINFKINDYDFSIEFNDDFYLDLNKHKSIWICGRDYNK